jgi:2-dehydro-3-deoxyphosphooctonate aldolase (KDO 8-P synthase)
MDLLAGKEDCPGCMYSKIVASDNFFLFAGPCVVEDIDMPLEIAKTIKAITDKLGIPYVFKASYEKANRSRLDSFRSIGMMPALAAIKRVRLELGVPTMTDVHSVEEAEIAAKYVDILQIPAFLCRQTDLLIAAGKTGKLVNIKKGQFMSPGAIKFAVDKVKSTGNGNVFVTERGTTFGYSDLVVDFRGIPTMKRQAPVVFDATHSLQQPNTSTGVTGGLPHLIETMAKASIAAGVDGLFIETHPDPTTALSDGANMLKLSELENLLTSLTKIKAALK